LALDLPPDETDALVRDRRRAAERVLGAPVFQIEQLALEDFALAKAFLDSTSSRTIPRDRRDELARRIAIYDRRSERARLNARPRQTLEERRQQVVLRQIIDKCRAGSFSALTLGEIDLLIHSHDLLMRHAGSPAEEDRLVDVVNRAVDEICARWAHLDRLKQALRSRG
jgi:hypothetical protein